MHGPSVRRPGACTWDDGGVDFYAPYSEDSRADYCNRTQGQAAGQAAVRTRDGWPRALADAQTAPARGYA